MLEKIGGIESLKTALIDDVTLATLVKKNGGDIYLGHSRLANSLRPYESLSDIWNMITRTAYVQLHYSIMLLMLTIVLMSLIWFLPLMQVIASQGLAQELAIVTYAISICSFIPTLSRFHLSILWIFALPFVALFYLMATIGSAVNHYFGKGVIWKGRAYAAPAIAAGKKEIQMKLHDIQEIIEPENIENISVNQEMKGQ